MIDTDKKMTLFSHLKGLESLISEIRINCERISVGLYYDGEYANTVRSLETLIKECDSIDFYKMKI